MHHPVVGHRSRRRAWGASLPARIGAALAATAVLLLAAPLVLEASSAPSEGPGWTAAASTSCAPAARADERAPHSAAPRGVAAGVAGAALPASERGLAVSTHRAAASSRACSALQRWLLSHATATSLS